MSIALEVAVRELQLQVKAQAEQIRFLLSEIEAIKQAPAIVTDVPHGTSDKPNGQQKKR